MKQYTSFRKKQGEEVHLLTNKFLKLKDSLLFQKQLKDTLLSSEKEKKIKIEEEKIDQQKLISEIINQEKKYKRELRKKEQEQKKISERIDKIINLPVKKPTSLCFGGKRLNMLFITSAKTFDKKNNKVEEKSGSIFVIKTKISGKKINFYKS